MTDPALTYDMFTRPATTEECPLIFDGVVDLLPAMQRAIILMRWRCSACSQPVAAASQLRNICTPRRRASRIIESIPDSLLRETPCKRHPDTEPLLWRDPQYTRFKKIAGIFPYRAILTNYCIQKAPYVRLRYDFGKNRFGRANGFIRAEIAV